MDKAKHMFSIQPNVVAHMLWSYLQPFSIGDLTVDLSVPLSRFAVMDEPQPGDITDVHAEWEQVQSIRDRYRTEKGLFLEHVRGLPLDINIVCACQRSDVLKPLLNRIKNPAGGEIGMWTIPDLETEWLVDVLNWSVCFCKLNLYD